MDIFRKSEIDSLIEELNEILDTMNIPIMRREDLRWLKRNIEFQNSTHISFNRAQEILNILLRSEEL